MHCDKHVVKMILEYAQLLSTAHRVLDGDEWADLKQQRAAALAQLEAVVSAPGKVQVEEIARLDRNFRDLGSTQNQYGCKDAPPLP